MRPPFASRRALRTGVPVLCVLSASLLFAGSSPPTPPSAETERHLEVTASPSELAVGDTAIVTARAFDVLGRRVSRARVEYSSAAPSLLALTRDPVTGAVLAIARGTGSGTTAGVAVVGTWTLSSGDAVTDSALVRITGGAVGPQPIPCTCPPADSLPVPEEPAPRPDPEPEPPASVVYAGQLLDARSYGRYAGAVTELEETITLGDQGDHLPQPMAPMQAILAFDLSGIPSGADILEARLVVTAGQVIGDPTALGPVRVDRVGSLTLWSGGTGGRFAADSLPKDVPVAIDVTGYVQSAIADGASSIRLRLRFERDTDADGRTDQVNLWPPGPLLVTLGGGVAADVRGR